MSQAREYLRRALHKPFTFNPVPGTDIESALARKLDEACAYSELYEALERLCNAALDSARTGIPFGSNSEGIDAARKALAHARGEK